MREFYHGTNPTAAVIISHKGFRIGTWFAVHMEDAICCGGPIVFTVLLDERRINQLAHPERYLEDEDGEFWQFHTRVPIMPGAIVKIQHLYFSELGQVSWLFQQ
jgi:hypothetical protein